MVATERFFPEFLLYAVGEHDVSNGLQRDTALRQVFRNGDLNTRAGKGDSSGSRCRARRWKPAQVQLVQ